MKRNISNPPKQNISHHWSLREAQAEYWAKFAPKSNPGCLDHSEREEEKVQISNLGEGEKSLSEDDDFENNGLTQNSSVDNLNLISMLVNCEKEDKCNENIKNKSKCSKRFLKIKNRVDKPKLNTINTSHIKSGFTSSMKCIENSNLKVKLAKIKEKSKNPEGTDSTLQLNKEFHPYKPNESQQKRRNYLNMSKEDEPKISQSLISRNLKNKNEEKQRIHENSQYSGSFGELITKGEKQIPEYTQHNKKYKEFTNYKSRNGIDIKSDFPQQKIHRKKNWRKMELNNHKPKYLNILS